MKKIGLALGGGGVRGLAHILVLELLDEMGCKPSIISGTSMGAVIGALYASGLSGKTIKERIFQYTTWKKETWRNVLKKRSDFLEWVKNLDLEYERGGILKADLFLKFLFAEIGKANFEDLSIPMIIIAADFWGAEEVVFKSGRLLPAIKASMAVPGVFAPVLIAGKVLVDGGIVNLVPYDHIMNRCDISIAVNADRDRTPGKRQIPGMLESVLGAFTIMQTANMAERMKRLQPDIYIHMNIRSARMLDFAKIESVFRQAGPAIEELRSFIIKTIV